ELAQLSLDNVAFVRATMAASAAFRRPLASLRLRGELTGLSLRHTRAMRQLEGTLRRVQEEPNPDATLRQRLIDQSARALESEQVLLVRLQGAVARADALAAGGTEGGARARDRMLARLGIDADVAAQLRSGEVQSQVMASVHAMQGVRVARALEPVGSDFAIRSDLFEAAEGYFRSLPDTVVTPGDFTVTLDPAGRRPVTAIGGQLRNVEPSPPAPIEPGARSFT